ncbi:hypothetical protein LTR15_009463 [Elasticomyces elasticus]|nr:hypothetical protein LTR15_009463 [Elasticomyces elasticus]
MMIIPNILLALAAATISGAKASPTALANTIRVPSELGVNVTEFQDYAYDGSEVVPTVFLDAPLQKRNQRPDECWLWSQRYAGHSLPAHADYEHQLANTIQWMRDHGNSIATISRGQGLTFTGTLLRIVVRNQSVCKDIKILYSTIAYYVQQVADFCDDESGWIAQAGSSGQTVIIVQPFAELPPPYNGQCPS